jgi:putative hydrolase
MSGVGEGGGRAVAAATQDMQVHSTFSDGADTIEDNLAEAEAFGLVELCCVDHVRADTGWLPEYTAAVAALGTQTTLTLHCGIEAKLLDTRGTLDMPAGELHGVDWIYAADHQVPMDDGVHHPDEVREGIESGRYQAADVAAGIVTATANCLPHHPGKIVIAHLFSILPKLGIAESDVPAELIESLADAAHATGNRIEVNERYRTPSAATLRPFVARGVPLLMSTDSHRRETIGRYDHCSAVVRELTVAPPAG